MSKPNFKFTSRSEISAFLSGINQSAETIIDAESDDNDTAEATRTGPHLCTHLAALIEQELTQAGYGKDEWMVDDISRHQTRVVISSAFCSVPLRIPGFEQLMNDLLNRYDAGDYSYTPEEARMNKKAEEVRHRNLSGHDNSGIPEILKDIMKLVNEIIGDRGEIRVLDEEEAMKLIREKMEKNKEEDKDGLF